MAEDPNSKDKALEALDFIINVLKEHEQNLDKSINELATVTEQIGDTEALNSTVGKVEEKINNLQKEVTNLIGYLSNAPKEPLSEAVKEQAPQVQATHAVSSTFVQVEPSVILRCKQWEDFQALTMHSQTLFFNYKEDKMLFQADALKGNQLITYSGAFPNFSIVLKKWLLLELDVAERNIFEGSLDRPE